MYFAAVGTPYGIRFERETEFLIPVFLFLRKEEGFSLTIDAFSVDVVIVGNL